MSRIGVGRDGFTYEFQADEKTMLWSKLAFLGLFALTGTASDMDKQGIFADSAWRARLESAVGEACAVAVADGAVVDRGKILATLASLPATMRSSMQKDVSAGRVPELDAIGARSFAAESVIISTSQYPRNGGENPGPAEHTTQLLHVMTNQIRTAASEANL